MQDAITNGTFQPGDRIVESDVAATLGVSRGPVREAARLLEQKGLVVSIPRRGFFVREFSRDADRGSLRAARVDSGCRGAVRGRPGDRHRSRPAAATGTSALVRAAHAAEVRGAGRGYRRLPSHALRAVGQRATDARLRRHRRSRSARSCPCSGSATWRHRSRSTSRSSRRWRRGSRTGLPRRCGAMCGPHDRRFWSTSRSARARRDVRSREPCARRVCRGMKRT